MAKTTATLFPIIDQQPAGIARMAAQATHADEGHLIEFKGLAVRSILNKSVSKRRISMAYSINPYRGCEFGCKYCYARYTHEFMAPKFMATETSQIKSLGGGGVDLRDPLMFERLIFLKQNAAWLLEQELKKIDPADEVALGTATDPYQPIERRARITRSLLEVFARRSGYRLGIVTKSRLIERDIDLLSEIARRNRLVVHVTITTADAELARVLEPRAPRPDLRFRAVKRLREAGIVAGVLGSPVLPGITDKREALDALAKRAAEAGASFFAAHALFLKPCSRPTYLEFVREHFPALEADYAKRYGGADFVTPEYSRKLEEMVEETRRRYGLGRRLGDALLTRDAGEQRRPMERVGVPVQARLFG